MTADLHRITEWSLHRLRLNPDENDCAHFFFHILDECREWYPMGAEMHRTEFFFGDDPDFTCRQVHLSGIDKDQCLWFVSFDDSCVIL